MKPCPFCGADGSRLHTEAVQHGTVWASSVVCRCCAAQGPWRKGATPEAADALARREWDKRGAGLDVLLCPGCGASVEPTMHPADMDEETGAGTSAGWSASCPCGFEGGAAGDPPTLRRILAGDAGGWGWIAVGNYTRAVARALGVLS